jgi:prevent-host-death family protein
MAEVQASEAKTHFLRLLDKVERGESFLITRRGKPVAHITPVADRRRTEVERAMEEIRALRPRFGPITVRELLAARDEGRKR